MHLRVYPCTRLAGEIDPPSSKNYTTRYLLAAALAEGESLVRFPAESEDAAALKRCLRALGAELIPDGPATPDNPQGVHLRVRGFGRRPKTPPGGVLEVGNAGTVLRLLLGTGSLLPEVAFVTSYAESLGKRPNQDLLDALQQLGVEARSQEGRLPITLRGGAGRLRGGKVVVSGAKSSQYISSLLFLAPLTGADVEIQVVDDLKSKPLIGQTLEVLAAAGIRVQASDDLMRFFVPGGQSYQAREYTVPGDYPGSAALLAAAAVTESDVTVSRLFPDAQGERAIIEVLQQMGAELTYEPQAARVHVRGGRTLRAVEFDGDKATDAVLAMTAAACFARGTSRFYNVENLRYKECDRISDYRRELLAAGCDVEETCSELIVHGRPRGVAGGAEIDSHYDHRVIMGLTIVGLRAERPLLIRDAHHVAKSYPDFFRHMRALGARLEEV